MSITTCQKVTLISCSVLCISLFLPRMLLPKGKKEMGRPEVGPGFYPPVMPQLSMPEDPERWGVDPSYSMTHSAEAMAKVKGIGRGKKYNLMAQAIPIYGFGILLYIFYIIYKLTCKGETTKSGNYTTVTKANMENRITPDELVRLQKRLLRTEAMMEKIVSAKKRGSGSSGRRRKSKTSISKKEEKLLKQLRQITQLIQEGRLEAVSPEMEAEEVPYCADWEGYPEETYPEYDEPYKKRVFHTFTLAEPPYQLTAEALAERMEQEEEEIMARKLSIVKEEDEEAQEEEESEEEEEEDEEDEDKEEEVEEVEEEIEEEEEEEVDEEEEEEDEEEAEKMQLLSLPSFQPAAERKQERLGLQLSKELQCLNGGKKQISFSDHKDVFRYPKEGTYEEEEEEKQEEVGEEDEGTEGEEEEEEDEEDPVMEAESLQFSCEGCPNPEEEAEEDKEEYLLVSEPLEEDSPIHADRPKEVGASGLRMRNRRET
ncbi:protein RIC-3 [Etheostoma cragini]|uniref:protein RIC-3 n=1 Tax=Etheostoma cragini TaxID=417921 RepID=UPI00155E01F4|nr:protein RIC-3 [Etheostoma cragini]